jgi:hypothetical protein
LHDTTEFSYQREKEASIGLLHRAVVGRDGRGRLRHRTICGRQMHSSLAVTTVGLPLGLAAFKFWTRQKFKGCNALKKKINPTRVPIEEKESFRRLENLRQAAALLAPADRGVHIGDRESDIYELFCEAQQVKTHFLFRTCVDRLAEDGKRTVAEVMKRTPKRGVHRLLLQDKNGESSEAMLAIKYRPIQVLPPIGKHKDYPALNLTVLHAAERGTPKNREKVDWKLISDLPVESLAEAIEKLDWYALRWKIETFHKILKSGCKVEQAKLRTADRLVNLIAVLVHPELPNLLDDHARAQHSASFATPCVDRGGGAPARRNLSRHTQPDGRQTNPCTLPHQRGTARRLSRPCARPTTRQHGDVARTLSPYRHSIRLRHRRTTCG